MFLTAVSWSGLACFNEQQPNSCPYQFAQTDDESHKGSVAGFHSESGYGHEKSSFASSELQGNEEEEIGEKRGEKQGELKKAKSIAISLAQEGESVERIARILGETEKTIKEWL